SATTALLTIKSSAARELFYDGEQDRSDVGSAGWLSRWSVRSSTRAMKTVSDRVVTVFGGTGFLGRRIVRHLRLHGFCVRVASRHPDDGQALFPPDDSQLRSISQSNDRSELRRVLAQLGAPWLQLHQSCSLQYCASRVGLP